MMNISSSEKLKVVHFALHLKELLPPLLYDLISFRVHFKLGEVGILRTKCMELNHCSAIINDRREKLRFLDSAMNCIAYSFKAK